MFSVRQKREISEQVQRILRATAHPELPGPEVEIRFLLCVEGAERWSWADIRNNEYVKEPRVNPWNEKQDAGSGKQKGDRNFCHCGTNLHCAMHDMPGITEPHKAEDASKQKARWCVVNHYNGETIRGPYVHLETASVVRRELELSRPEANWNLWVTTGVAPSVELPNESGAPPLSPNPVSVQERSESDERARRITEYFDLFGEVPKGMFSFSSAATEEGK